MKPSEQKQKVNPFTAMDRAVARVPAALAEERRQMAEIRARYAALEAKLGRPLSSGERYQEVTRYNRERKQSSGAA